MSPVIKASMANVSTEYVLPDPGLYRFEVAEIKEETARSKAPKSGQEVERVTYIVKSKIVSDADGNDEHANKPVFDYINLHTKEGDINEISLANLKRYFEAISPDSAESEEADTDELVGGHFMAQLYHDSWENEAKGTSGTSAKIKATSISPVD
jgi:hypothetical protein